jgi:hypothetical protein
MTDPNRSLEAIDRHKFRDDLEASQKYLTEQPTTTEMQRRLINGFFDTVYRVLNKVPNVKLPPPKLNTTGHTTRADDPDSHWVRVRANDCPICNHV